MEKEHRAAPGAVPDDHSPAASADPGETFDSLDPRTGDVIGTWPRQSPEEVGATVGRAHQAAASWQAHGFDGRRRYLKAWNSEIARGMGDLASLVNRENGKPHADAILEIALAIEHIRWAATHAEKVLGRRRVGPGSWRRIRRPRWNTCHSVWRV